MARPTRDGASAPGQAPVGGILLAQADQPAGEATAAPADEATAAPADEATAAPADEATAAPADEGTAAPADEATAAPADEATAAPADEATAAPADEATAAPADEATAAPADEATAAPADEATAAPADEATAAPAGEATAEPAVEATGQPLPAPDTTPPTTAGETQLPAGPTGAPPVDVLVTAGVALLLAVFFVWALVRARKRRRREIAGLEEPADLQVGPAVPREAPPARPDVTSGTPERAGEPAVLPPQAPPTTPEEIEAARKEARRLAFEEKQRAGREARLREETMRAEAEAAAAREAEETARREAEAAEARRQALLAPSGPLTERLSQTRSGFVGRLSALIGRQIDEDTLEEIEEVLFTADIGVGTATKLLDTVREELGRKDLQDPERIRAALKERIAGMLAKDGAGPTGGLDPSRAASRPYVLMVVGVNGVGKTTTIGKLAGRFIAAGQKVVLAAGDTFRAAAVEQLEIWGERVGAEVVKGGEGTDPASVVYDAVEHAKATGADVVIADTAGRLHTKIPLMEELKKVHRVMGKARAGAPDDVLLVVDATTGQNAMQQARIFQEVVPLTGIALTKLDGTAKGGVIIGISDELELPVRYIGVGEKVGDLQPFEPRAFVDALFAT